MYALKVLLSEYSRIEKTCRGFFKFLRNHFLLQSARFLTMQPLINLARPKSLGTSRRTERRFCYLNIRRLRGRGETLLLRNSLSFFLSFSWGWHDGRDDPREEISDLEASRRIGGNDRALPKTYRACERGLGAWRSRVGRFHAGLLGDSPLPLVIGLSALLGGVVLLGSNMNHGGHGIRKDMKAAEAAVPS